jgi:hypothetical protein
MEREETGLLRLIISHIDPSVDCAVYKLHIFNIHGEDECEASLIFDSNYIFLSIIFLSYKTFFYL